MANSTKMDIIWYQWRILMQIMYMIPTIAIQKNNLDVSNISKILPYKLYFYSTCFF